jgi:hypothetical protein
MSTFKIIWEIEVEAETPLDAAKEAKEILQDKGSEALCFYVQKEGEHNEQVTPLIYWRTMKTLCIVLRIMYRQYIIN